MPAEKHNSLQLFLVTLMRRLQYWIVDGELRMPPTRLYLEDKQMLVPDVFWVGPHNQRCHVNGIGDWNGAPDLVIEVVTPQTEALDRGEKFQLYQKHEVFEYWIINPALEFIEVFVLMNKHYFRTGLYQPGDNFSSGVLNGRSFQVNDLFGKSKSS